MAGRIYIYIYIYIYILESTGALRAPLILRIPRFVFGSMASKVAVLKTWIQAAALSRLAPNTKSQISRISSKAGSQISLTAPRLGRQADGRTNRKRSQKGMSRIAPSARSHISRTLPKAGSHMSRTTPRIGRRADPWAGCWQKLPLCESSIFS